MRQVEQIMGMPITIDIPECPNRSVFKTAFDRFRQIDARFSTYRPDSEVSKLNNLNNRRLSSSSKSSSRVTPENTPVNYKITPYITRVTLEEVRGELRDVVLACQEAEKWTGGYFSAWAAGAFDPSGYVKGWAIAEAGKIIEKQGHKTYCISAGGDILARSDSGKVWRIGIQDPLNKEKILNMLSISSGAAATSGNYERGAHIVNPKTGRAANDFLSVTITGPDIIKADILATACFAMGRRAAQFMKSQNGYEMVAVSRRSRGSNQ